MGVVVIQKLQKSKTTTSVPLIKLGVVVVGKRRFQETTTTAIKK